MDKFTHLGLSWMLQNFFGLLFVVLGCSPLLGNLLGLALALGVGVIKEVWDERHGGKFDLGDLFFDILGAVGSFTFNVGLK